MDEARTLLSEDDSPQRTEDAVDEQGGGVETPGAARAREKLVDALREMSAVRSERLTAWRGTLRECTALLPNSPPGGDDVQCSSDSFSGLIQSAGEEIEEIMERLLSVMSKLEAAVISLPAEEEEEKEEEEEEKEEEQGESTVRSLQSNDPETSAPPGDIDADAPSRDEGEGEGGGRAPDLTSNGADCRDDVGEGEGGAADGGQLGEAEKDLRGTSEETRSDRKVEPAVQQQEAHPGLCFIKAPSGVAAALRCEPADALSSLMVAGSEELLSRVVRVTAQDDGAGAAFGFPVTVVVPFQARYRGSYRDVAVKVVDDERRASYIAPLATEGCYGGQRGSFAEARAYSLGLFAVVSCLKRESYTVPKRGLALKVAMDPRIALNYLPGTFSAPVMAQTMVQPLEAVLLTTAKSRNEAYGCVASTSPLLYLTHPTSQPLRRPLSVTLPCPPNPDKKRGSGGPTDEQDHLKGAVKASLGSNRNRILGASGKARETCNESLAALGAREGQWSVLDKVNARNQQNGLVSFDLTENFDRLLVVRLLSPPPPPGVLAALAGELEESARCHAVTVVLRRRQDEPHAALVAAVPSRELGWELGRLWGGHGGHHGGRPGGHHGGPLAVDASSEVTMCEADQLLLRFSGNITSRADRNGPERLTFHSQRRNQLALQLTEVDPFGNYSSPHYKGTLLFYRVARGRLGWSGDADATLTDPQLLGEPVCKLSLTLPKKVRKINRPIATRVKLCEEAVDSLSDSLLLWLSAELSEEEVSLLVASLRLRRSAVQMARLRAGDGPSSRAFHLLATWRRGLPAVPRQPKASQLARCLTKSGRPDLARELLLRQAATARHSPLN